MKKFGLFLGVFVVGSICAYIYIKVRQEKARMNDQVEMIIAREGNDSVRVKSPYDTVGLLKLLFNPATMEKNLAAWKPDPDAKLNMQVSDDGYCYTNVDTIIKLPDAWLVIFTTIAYDTLGLPIGVHAYGANYGCAKIVMANGKYNIAKFNRWFTTRGSYGNKADSIGIVKAGRDYLLFIVSGFTNSGETIENIDYYETNSFTNVFSYASYDSDDGLYDDSTKVEVMKRKMEFVPNGSAFYNDITLTTDKKHFSETKKKFVHDVSVELYQWDKHHNNYQCIRHSKQD